MKTDVQIAQEATLLPIIEIAKRLGISEDDLELFGKYKAKVSLDVLTRLKDKPDGKLVLVTAITPTPTLTIIIHFAVLFFVINSSLVTIAD